MLELLRLAYRKWRADNAASMAAALAYHALFAAVPLTFFLLNFLGASLGRAAARVELTRVLNLVTGPNITKFVLELAETPRTEKFAGAAVAVVLGLIAGSLAVNQLRTSLNQIWQVPRREYDSWIKHLVAFVGFLILLGLAGAVFFLGAVAVSASGAVAGRLPAQFSELGIIGSLSLIFLGSAALFGAVYRLLPQAPLKTRDVLSGALLSAAFFTLGNLAIGFYFYLHNPASLYGTGGTLLALLIWIYYSAQIFYFGAEITYAYANRK